MIAGVIFDMDGTLIDSEPIWRIAEIAAFEKVGISLTEDMLAEHTAGMRNDEVVKYWFNYFKNENEYADTTKWGYLNDFVKFVRQCDKNRISPETELAVTMWERYLTESVRLGNLHVNSARKLISSIKTVDKTREDLLDDRISIKELSLFLKSLLFS